MRRRGNRRLGRPRTNGADDPNEQTRRMDPDQRHITTDAAQVYARRLSERKAEAEKLSVTDRYLSVARFTIFRMSWTIGIRKSPGTPCCRT